MQQLALARTSFSTRFMTKPLVHTDDAELLRMMLAGDEAAFGLLYDRLQGGIYRFALRMSSSEAFAEDVLLLIEVADTSLRYDRSTKLRLYAEAGVLEYWLVDCNAESIEVFRAPGPGGYRDVSRISGDSSVNVQAFEDVLLRTGEIFA